MAKIDARVTESPEVHLNRDNCQTHKTTVVKMWLRNHPRFLHAFRSDVLILAEPGRAVLRIRHRVPAAPQHHRSVQALESDIRKWVSEWDTTPTPFTWTKTAEQIL